MREQIKDKGRLEHILQAINDIQEYHKQYTYDDIKRCVMYWCMATIQ